MHFIYNQIAIFVSFVFAALARRLSPRTKLRRFILLQQGLMERIERELAGRQDERPTIWFHASSYGEYNIARPIVRRLHDSGRWRIVLTFFSPTGIEMYHMYKEEIDAVFPLPLDTPDNAARFLNAVRPQKAVFLVSEYWVNYLTELHVRGISTFLVSATITEKALPLRWYGGMWRQAMKGYRMIFVLNELSRQLLSQCGITRVRVIGDPLFDNVLARAAKDYQNPVIEHFASQGDVFIAGSIHNDRDLQLVTKLANHHPDTHFLIVPHELSEDMLNDIIGRLKGPSRLYSECTGQTDFSSTQTLIIDFMGALTYLYRFARWAYVGGGFTPYLHSVIEATAYGLPVAFGPRLERKLVARELVQQGIGCSVRSSAELDKWFTSLKDDSPRMQVIARRARHYMQAHTGATDLVVKTIENDED